MRQWRVTAEIKVSLPGGDPYLVSFEYTVQGMDQHAAGVEADDVIQAELEVFDGYGTLESLDLEEL